MLLTIFNIFYVLIAIAMCILILLQRGDGAAAGSGFGGGASATVFGARGATTFLSRATAVLAALFFVLSIIMGITMHPRSEQASTDIGVMSGMGATPAATTPAAAPAAPAKSDVPAAPVKNDLPVAPAAATSDKPAATPAPTPAAPATAEHKDAAKPAQQNKH